MDEHERKYPLLGKMGGNNNNRSRVYRLFNELYGFASVTNNPRAIVIKVYDLFNELEVFGREGAAKAYNDMQALLFDKLMAAGMDESDLPMVDEYVENAVKGEKRLCLFCRSENVIQSSINVTGRNTIQHMVCEDCKGTWNDVFTLQGVLIESRPENNPEANPGPGWL